MCNAFINPWKSDGGTDMTELSIRPSGDLMRISLSELMNSFPWARLLIKDSIKETTHYLIISSLPPTV